MVLIDGFRADTRRPFVEIFQNYLGISAVMLTCMHRDSVVQKRLAIGYALEQIIANT